METTTKLIEILGPGCARCYEAHRVVTHVVEQSGADWVVRKDESIDRMVELGVLRTPAIVLDGRVVHQGSVPKSEDVRRLLGLA